MARVRTLAAVVAGLTVLGGVWFLGTRLEREAPTVGTREPLRFVGNDTAVTVMATDEKSGLATVRLWLQQGATIRELAVEEFPGGLLGGGEHVREITLRIDARSLRLDQGPATLYASASDHSWWGLHGNRTVREFPLVVDTLPPRVDLLSTAHNVAVGGAGLVVYRLGEEAASTGIEVAGRAFPGYLEPAGGPRTWVAFFVLPHDDPTASVSVTAVDGAGNATRRTLPIHVIRKSYRDDAINLSDSFLAAKIPEFAAADPSLPGDPLEAFLVVNRQWRERDHRKIAEITATGRAGRLWSGAFLQMRNTQSMATYAQRRTYLFHGRQVDRQTHLGLDLASTAGAPVPASNRGAVAFAGDLGIYGQTVILDHGQGLFSLYAHLSGISVGQGDVVDRGQALGTSGQTGMAGGDHLHFAMLVSGVFTNPVEWLDQHWIDDNVRLKLEGLTPAG